MMPKQFINNLFDKSLFSKALELVSDPEIFYPAITITNQNHLFLALEAYENAQAKIDRSIILEPCSRNTALAILAGAMWAAKIYNDPEVAILALPSDHLINPKAEFISSVLKGLEVIDKKIITFGVKPQFAATSYGYIKRGGKISANCYEIGQFIEKPAVAKAEVMIKDESYFWNAGIFLLRADVYENEVTRYLPAASDAAKRAIETAIKSEVSVKLGESGYANAPNISIDYAVLEKSQNVALVELSSDWSDVGDFDGIHRASEKDQNRNVEIGNIKSYETSNSFLYASEKMLVGAGLDNIIAVESGDCILVADRSKSQFVKQIVEDLQKKNPAVTQLHPKVSRPWGTYETISHGEFFKVKKIFVKPHASLSLQLHNQRSEHWVVVKGEATVQKNEEVFTLKAGESTFIPVKSSHRLSNKTDADLEIIEVQIGGYLEEDDIVRLEDNYGRK